MEVFYGNYEKVYFDLVDFVSRYGDVEEPRGLKVTSYPTPVVCRIEEPWNCFLDIPGRKFNYKFAAAEVFWILSGNGNVDAIAEYNPQMKEYSNMENSDTFRSPYFHGSYGRRIRQWGQPEPYGLGYPIVVDQLALVIDRLKKDLQTRQAVISLFDPIKDYVIPGRRDYPCNNVVYFRVVKDQLEITVVRRSNDLIWGFPYNIIQFAAIQMLIANSIQIYPGPMTIFIQNAHIYHQPRKYTMEKNKVLKGKDVCKSINFSPIMAPKTFYASNVTIDDMPITNDALRLKVLLQSIANISKISNFEEWFTVMAKVALSGKVVLSDYWV